MEACLETRSYHIRKNMIVCSFAIVFMLFFSFIFMNLPHAEEETVDSEISNVIAEWQRCANTVKNVVESSNMVDETAAKFTLIEQIRDNGGIVDSLSSVAVTFANVLIVLFIFVGIIRESMRGDPSMDFWFKVFGNMILVCMVASNWSFIRTKIDEAASAIVHEAVKAYDTVQYDDSEIAGISAFGGGGSDSQTRNDALLQACTDAPMQMLADAGIIIRDYEQVLPTSGGYGSNGTGGGENDVGGITMNYWHELDAQQTEQNDERVDNEVVDAESQNLSELFPDGIILDSSHDTQLIVFVINVIVLIFKVGFLCAVDAQLFFIVIQMILRGAFMPIAFASLAEEGMRGNAMRYLKRYIALYLQWAIIMVITMMFGAILLAVLQGTPSVGDFGETIASFSDAVGGSIPKIYYILTCMGATMTAVSKSGSFAQEILGD